MMSLGDSSTMGELAGTLIWESSGKNPELVEVFDEEKRNTKKIFAENNCSDSNDQYIQAKLSTS